MHAQAAPVAGGVPTRNAKLLAWVDEVAKLTQPDRIYWCDGSRGGIRPPVRRAGRRRHLPQAEPDKLRPNSYLACSDPARRGPRRGPHLHLLADARTTPAPPTTGSSPAEMRATLQRRSSTAACAAARCTWCRSRMGPLGSHIAHIGVELSDSALRRREHADHDAHGRDGARRARRRRRLRALPALRRRAARAGPEGRRLALQQRTSTSSTSPRRARSGRTARATAATRCWARSASRCASPRSWAATRAGSPSTC